MHHRLAELLEATTDFVGTATLDGRLVWHNSAARDMLELSDDVGSGHLSLAHILPGQAKALVLEKGIPTAVREGSWRCQTTFLIGAGRQLLVNLLLVAHQGKDGHLPFFSVIARKAEPGDSLIRPYI